MGVSISMLAYQRHDEESADCIEGCGDEGGYEDGLEGVSDGVESSAETRLTLKTSRKPILTNSYCGE